MPAEIRRAAWLAVLLTVWPFYGEAQQDRRTTSWDPCTPCANLVNFVYSRRVGARSSALTPRLPSIETLGWIPFEQVAETDRVAWECLAATGVVAVRRETPLCTLSTGELRDFLDELRRVRRRFEQLHSERRSFTRLVAWLHHPAKQLGRRSLWPVGFCVDCDAVSASLEGMLEVVAAAREVLRLRIGRAREAADALEKMRPLKSELCRHRRVLFEFDREGFAHDYQYFTWTEGWRAFETVHGALNDSLVAQLCR